MTIHSDVTFNGSTLVIKSSIYVASSIEIAFITIANVLSLKRLEFDVVNVVTQTFFGFSKLKITGSNFYDSKILANSYIIIYISSRNFSLTIIFRFFAFFLSILILFL